MTEQARAPELADVLRAAVQGALEELHTAIPARVESYDNAAQKVNAKPLLKRTIVAPDGQEISEELPVIQDIPVVFPRAGNFFLSLPIQRGDHVLLVFIERSTDRFATGDGEVTDPIDLRHHDLSDAVAIPGFYPFGNSLDAADADPAELVIGKQSGARIFVSDDHINLFEKSAAAEYVALADKTNQRIEALENTVIGLVGAFNAHVHPASPGPTSAIIQKEPVPGNGASVAASHVKAS